MSKTALVILTQPLGKIRAQLPVYLSQLSKLVTRTAYIHIQPECSSISKGETSNVHQATTNDTSAFQIFRLPFSAEIRSIIKDFYIFSAKNCSSIDIRVFVGHIQNSNLRFERYELKEPCDLVLIDKDFSEEEIPGILKTVAECFSVKSSAECGKLVPGTEDKIEGGGLDHDTPKRQKVDDISQNEITSVQEIQQYPYTVLGGTFDRLHIGHKILLTEGCLLGTDKMTVGVTEGEMNKKKVLEELIQPIEERITAVKEYLNDIKPDMEYSVVPITDGFGPTVVEPDMDLIVLSEETKKGGEMINVERKKRGFKPLLEYTIDLVEDTCHSQYEEDKISSSSSRKRLLGTLYHPINAKDSLPAKPYIIGLTGGIASGKSSVCKRLEGLGTKTVDCDKLGHRAYVKGTAGFDKVVKVFGEHVIGEDGEINRRELGKIVFGNKEEMQKLNGIVWPEIAKLAQEQIAEYERGGHDVIVLDAAVLLEAGWDDMCHEVWATVVPPAEAVKRMVERNNLTEEQAKQRLASQISNGERVGKSNVILCTLWEYEYTQQQVERAWKLLLQRLSFCFQDIRTKSNM